MDFLIVVLNFADKHVRVKNPLHVKFSCREKINCRIANHEFIAWKASWSIAINRTKVW